jgi:histidinol-phosphate aminotransferase
MKLARLHRCHPDNLIIGNGSDELLALATRAFVEPRAATRAAGGPRRPPGPADSASIVQFFEPSYSLYPVLAAIHGALPNPVPLQPDFSLPSMRDLRRGKRWNFHAALTFVTTPNAPSGRGYRTRDLEALCRAMDGVVVLDEAYADFAEENALPLALTHPQVIVSRTFSKAYSLCFQRVGYFVGPARLIAALHKIRDSYNINGLGQVAAVATVGDLPHYRRTFKTILESRADTAEHLEALGFDVLPSQANFLLVRPPKLAASTWMKRLRARGILVRWFETPEVRRYLRITIGTPPEMRRLIREAQHILNAPA